jgi:RNA-directed DNA polymerase
MKPLPKWKGKKLHSLMPLLFRKRTMMAAWDKVKKNKGAPGVDGETVEEFGKDAKGRTRQIGEVLRLRTWRPKPLRRVWIPKPDGTKRGLAIASVEDRVVHAVVAMVLYQVFEDRFGPECFAYVEGRNALQAVERVQAGIRARKTWIVETDVSKFFDTVDRRRLMDKVAERIADGTFLRLISAILRAKIFGEDIGDDVAGMPQGSPLSPLLANIYLADFDRKIGSRWLLTRYADDLVVQCATREEAEEALTAIEEELRKEGLSLNKDKTRITKARNGFDFLGYHINDWEVGPSRKSVKKFQEKIRSEVRRHDAGPMEERVKKVMPIVYGWTHYFRLTRPSKVWDLGGWLLRRMRTRKTKRKTYWKWNLISWKDLHAAGLKLPYQILKGYIP